MCVRRNCVASRSGSSLTCRPIDRNRARVGRSIAPRRFSSVDLPQPDGPTIATYSPRIDVERHAANGVHGARRPAGSRGQRRAPTGAAVRPSSDGLLAQRGRRSAATRRATTDKSRRRSPMRRAARARETRRSAGTGRSRSRPASPGKPRRMEFRYRAVKIRARVPQPRPSGSNRSLRSRSAERRARATHRSLA